MIIAKADISNPLNGRMARNEALNPNADAKPMPHVAQPGANDPKITPIVERKPPAESNPEIFLALYKIKLNNTPNKRLIIIVAIKLLNLIISINPIEKLKNNWMLPKKPKD